jgi:hypothetical protein
MFSHQHQLQDASLKSNSVIAYCFSKCFHISINYNMQVAHMRGLGAEEHSPPRIDDKARVSRTPRLDHLNDLKYIG